MLCSINDNLISIGDHIDKGLFVWEMRKNLTLMSQNKIQKKVNTAFVGPGLVTLGDGHIKIWGDEKGFDFIEVGNGQKYIEGKSIQLNEKFQKMFIDGHYIEKSLIVLSKDGMVMVFNEKKQLLK